MMLAAVCIKTNRLSLTSKLSSCLNEWPNHSGCSQLNGTTCGTVFCNLQCHNNGKIWTKRWDHTGNANESYLMPLGVINNHTPLNNFTYCMSTKVSPVPRRWSGGTKPFISPVCTDLRCRDCHADMKFNETKPLSNSTSNYRSATWICAQHLCSENHCRSTDNHWSYPRSGRLTKSIRRQICGKNKDTVDSTKSDQGQTL